MGSKVVTHLRQYFCLKKILEENQLEGADALPYVEEKVYHLEKACDRAAKISPSQITFEQIEESKNFFT